MPIQKILSAGLGLLAPIYPVSVYPTYASAVSGIVPLSSGEFFNICGSDTKTIIVSRIYVNGATSDSQSQRLTVKVIKRSSVGDPVSAATAVAVPNNSKFDAATAVVRYWTSGLTHTAGTPVGTIVAGPVVTMTASPSSADPHSAEVIFPGSPATPIVLNGPSECLSLVTDDTWSSNSSINIGVVWMEI